MRRRQLLLGGPLAAASFVILRGRVEAPKASLPQEDPEPPFRRRILLVANDGRPLEAHLSTQAVYQGGALRVRAAPGSAGTASIFGRVYPLLPAAAALEGYVGIGTEDPVGPARLKVTVAGGSGQDEAWPECTILKTRWTVDYITVPPPNPNDPDPPPPDLPDEQPRLNAIYQGVSRRRWREPWAAPLARPFAVSGYFGEQRSFNGGPVSGHHGGTDFGAEAGTPVIAVNDAVVALAERVRVRGRLVVLDHGGGVFSSYGHMSSLAVREGDVVSQGQVVGTVGSTGLSTGPHLHWEMAVGGVLVDGLRWIDGSQGF
jgi:murein DD-endopeptidase MepM/ murein hydrolase activator NlpD